MPETESFPTKETALLLDCMDSALPHNLYSGMSGGLDEKQIIAEPKLANV